MTDATSGNLYTAFVAEAKAHFRLLAYAEAAEAEALPEIAALFRAVAEAERIHATRHLSLLGDVIVQDTEGNLQASFAREEKAADNFYPQFMREADEEGKRRAMISFSQARDVEEEHAALYKRALQHLIASTTPVYYVCQLCGYIAEGEAPERCPVCGARVELFRRTT